MVAPPHPIPYQGSKRRLAAAILSFVPSRIGRLVEPFAGSAAVTLAAAHRSIAERYLLGEKLKALAALWLQILRDPGAIADSYEEHWKAQIREGPAEYFVRARKRFNESQDPALLLYLLVRCVKNAVRFNPRGEFNQSPDHRRLGMRPEKMRKELARASSLLSRQTEVLEADYQSLLEMAAPGDLVYLDPPYQGVSGGKDPRYIEGLDLTRLYDNLDSLSRRNVPFILSFDGSCGTKEYGESIPAELRLTRVLVDAGVSSQATLSGRSERTIESVYLSHSLVGTRGHVPTRISIEPRVAQITLEIA